MGVPGGAVTTPVTYFSLASSAEAIPPPTKLTKAKDPHKIDAKIRRDALLCTLPPFNQGGMAAPPTPRLRQTSV
jgi:hypothetical protein